MIVESGWVKANGRKVHVTKGEERVLHFILKNQPVTGKQIHEALFAPHAEPNIVKVHIARLRAKLLSIGYMIPIGKTGGRGRLPPVAYRIINVENV